MPNTETYYKIYSENEQSDRTDYCVNQIDLVSKIQDLTWVGYLITKIELVEGQI